MGLPSAMTRPASMAACARARLSKTPRATRSRSARSRLLMANRHYSYVRVRPTCTASPEFRRAAENQFARRSRLSELDYLALDVLPERLECFGDDAFGVEARFGIHGVWAVLVDENVRQHHGADLEAAIKNAVLGERLHHEAAEPADRALLHREQHFVSARQAKQQVNIERFGEARVGDRGRQAKGRKLVGCLEALAKPGAERKQRDLAAFAHDAAFADLERLALCRKRNPEPFATRITQCRRAVVDGDGSRNHVHKLGFIGRSHEHKAGQTTEISDVEGARMSGAVGAHKPGAVHGETYRQALDRDVMHDLVIGALQERRIDRRKRLVAFGGKAGGEGYAVLFGDADVKCSVWKFLLEQVNAGTGRHRCRDRNDLVVLARFLDQAFGIDFRILRRRGF